VPVSRAFLYIYFSVPSKGAIPSDFPHRTPTERERERCSVSRALRLSLKVPGKMSPSPGSPKGPYEESCLFPEPSFTYLRDSPLNKASL